MIKLEDRASVVILSLITFMGIFYAIMFLNDTFATAFANAQVKELLMNKHCSGWDRGAIFILLFPLEI